MHGGPAFKTTAPRVLEHIERPALVAAFRDASGRSNWIAAPAGSGKSALGAAYAIATGRTIVWYRCDARDNDPVFFYTEFAMAWRAATSTLAPLPGFAPEDHAEADAFAGRFVAALAQAAGSGVLVVIDDAHEVHAPDVLATWAAAAGGSNAALEWLFIALEGPPSAMFDAISARSLAICNDLPFACSFEECNRLAHLLRVPHPDGGHLRALTGGHPAAIVLACELLRDVAADSRAARDGLDPIYEHLLKGMLSSLVASRRDLLEAMALVPVITPAIAAELAGHAASGELEYLAERGLLRRLGGVGIPKYEMHSLLRAGLRRRMLTGSAAARMQVDRTVLALLNSGALEDARALSAEIGDVEKTLAIVEMLAPEYARSGRSGLLLQALDPLPIEVVRARGKLCYWTGHALLGNDEEAARSWFEHSYCAFAAEQSRHGMRLAAAAVMTAFVLEYGDIRTFDTWLARYRDAGGDAVVAGSEDEAALTIGALAVAVSLGHHEPGVDGAVIASQLRAMLDEPAAWLNGDQKVEAARLLLDHACIIGTHEQAQAMVAETRAHAENPDASALQRGRWYLSAACSFFESGMPGPSAALLAEATSLASESGSRRLSFELGMTCIDASLKVHDLDAAQAHLAGIAFALPSATLAQRAEFARLSARVLLVQRRFDEGLRWARDALSSARAAGYSGSHLRAFEVEHAYALAGNGRLADAIAAMEASTIGAASAQQHASLAIVDCLRYLAGGEADLSLLSQGLAHAAEDGFIHLLARAGDCLPRICSSALEAGIQVPFVLRLVATQRLLPPPDAGPAWPWPVRVRTLGAFTLAIEGRPYQPAHKAQDKPLELLKLLVCCQAMGRPSAAKDWIVERLWPDADVGNGRKSLDMAASRLRKILGTDDALVASEGRLGLSPGHVWTDVAVLRRTHSRVAGHRDAHLSGRDLLRDSARADLARMVEHYRGPLLPDDDDRPWLLAGREAVTSLVRTAVLAADAILAGADDEQLGTVMECLIVADPTSEQVARALMRVRMRQGRYAEALATYRRTKDMLSLILALPPASETLALRDAIYAKVQSGIAFDATVMPANR